MVEKRGSRWRARAWLEGRLRTLGTFATEEEAQRAEAHAKAEAERTQQPGPAPAGQTSNFKGVTVVKQSGGVIAYRAEIRMPGERARAATPIRAAALTLSSALSCLTGAKMKHLGLFHARDFNGDEAEAELAAAKARG